MFSLYHICEIVKNAVLSYNFAMQTAESAAVQLREEFSKYIASGRPEQFAPSMQSGTAVSVLTRDLEMKRELDKLSAQEKSALAEIDTLWENIAKFNQGRPRASDQGERVYSLKDSKFLEPEMEPLVNESHPPISHEQADEIIEGLNKQFEEKIMSKRRDVATGRNLQEYLALVQEKPRLPFAGEESQIDLSKLKRSE